MADANPVLSMIVKRSRHLVLALTPLPLAVLVGSWYLTEPLETRPAAAVAAGSGRVLAPRAAAQPAAPALDPGDGSPAAGTPEASAGAEVVWPEEGVLDGRPAKDLLLKILLVAQERLGAMAGYTATFRKQERLGGELGAMQTLRMKVRHAPFSVYLKFLEPNAGKEAVYSEGRYDNHVVAHNGDWSRLLVPRLKVAPDSSIALADNRHPITDAGLKNLVDKLVVYRVMDLEDEEAVTILDRTTDERGRTWLRSLHTHPHRRSERPFARVVVLYDPESFLPHRIDSFDWPEPGHQGELELAECYVYDDLDTDVTLDDRDFDPANPEYAFSRY